MATLKINGASHRIESDGETPLLWVLRDELGLTGTKYGCGRAQCGACTVFVDGKPTRSCVLPVRHLADKTITTIEGLDGGVAGRVGEAWRELQVPQCGFCQSGQIMTAVALLSQVPEPSNRQIDAAMAGNVCRCATYDRIRKAIHRAAGQGGAS